MRPGKAVRRLVYNTAQAVLARFNVSLYRRSLQFLHSPDFDSAINPAIEGIPRDRLFTLFSLCRNYRGTGDLAECGVLRGKSAWTLLTATAGASRPPKLFIFDSFAGLSDPGAADGALWQAGDLSVDEAVTRRNLAPFADRLEVFRGWIPERFPDVDPDARFFLVHVDVDLYEPTLACYRFFWDRLVPGGFIVCDDYGFLNCPGARRAVDEFVAEHDLSIIEISAGQAIIQKPATA